MDQVKKREREALGVFSGCMLNCTMWIPLDTIARRASTYDDLVYAGYLEKVPNDSQQPDIRGYKVTFSGEIVLKALYTMIGAFLGVQEDYNQEGTDY